MIGRLCSKATVQWFIVLFAISIATEVVAAPSVTNVTGALTHGSSITITGTGFGAKGGTDPNKPLIWADLESSIQPTSLGIVTSWGVINNMSLSSAAPQYGLSAKNAVGTFSPSQLSHNFEFTRTFTGKVYVYAKRYYEFAQPTNIKMFRFWSTNDSAWNIVSSTSNGGIILNESCVDPDRFQFVPWLQNQWVTEEFRINLGTVDNCGGNSGNGSYQWVRNGVQVQFEPTLTTGTTLGKNYGRLIMLDNFTDIFNPPASGERVWLDDLYADDTWAHVIVGNANTLAGCTQREVQVPTAWADTAITVKLNRGAFGVTAGAWLYVVDANNVASAGFPITFAGGGGDTTPPTAPSNLIASAVSTSQIGLIWTASTDNVGVTGYRVERCQGAGCSNFTEIAQPTIANFSDAGLSPSTSYSYRVRATDAAGNLSGYSNTSSATTQADITPPAAPTGLQVS